MKISCPECSAHYDLPVSLLVNAQRMRCAKCGHIWMQQPLQEKPVFGGYQPSGDDADIDPIPMSVHPQDIPDDEEDADTGPGILSGIQWGALGRMVAGFVLAWVLAYGVMYGLLAAGNLPGALRPLAVSMGLNAGASAAGLELDDVKADNGGKTTIVSGVLTNASAHARVIPMIEVAPAHGEPKHIKPEQDTLSPGASVSWKTDMGILLDGDVSVRLLAH